MCSTLYILPWSEEIHAFQETAAATKRGTFHPSFQNWIITQEEMQESEVMGQRSPDSVSQGVVSQKGVPLLEAAFCIPCKPKFRTVNIITGTLSPFPPDLSSVPLPAVPPLCSTAPSLLKTPNP